jgi:serine/threonine protein kinase
MESSEELHIDDFFVLQNWLGKGNFGAVQKAINKQTGRTVALKCFTKQKEDKIKTDIIEEALIWKLLNHPNVVKFYDSIKGEYETFLEMELIEGNDLRFHINRRIRRNEPFSENFIWKLLAKIGSALYHVHNTQIIHRDIKPENILVSLFGEFKLCDFGLSAISFENDIQTDQCGTLPYYSPEMIYGSYSFPTDVWSLGITIY